MNAIQLLLLTLTLGALQPSAYAQSENQDGAPPVVVAAADDTDAAEVEEEEPGCD